MTTFLKFFFVHFQILISGLFVSFCQCKRLWPGPEARNNHKLFLVLFVSLVNRKNFWWDSRNLDIFRHFCMVLKLFVRLWFMMIWTNLMLKLCLHCWLFLLQSCLYSFTSKIHIDQNDKIDPSKWSTWSYFFQRTCQNMETSVYPIDDSQPRGDNPTSNHFQ